MIDTAPRFDLMAAQLRKPSGNAAATTAQNMDKANAPLFDLTLRSMRIQGHERILEIGFGSGSFIQKLFSNDTHLKMNGIDYSPEMVAIARMANSALIQSGYLALDEGSSDQLPFEDATFDIIYSNMVIFFWDDPEVHLREVRRVLKPAGKLYTGFRTKKSMMNFPFVKYGFTLYEPEEWQALLEKNGFKPIRTDRQQDPPIQMNGNQLQLESVCVVAEKPGNV